MKKTILIPTDFTIESLKMTKIILSQSSGEYKYNVIFLHGVYMSDSITDFLFYSKTKIISSLTNKLFDEACAILRNKFMSHINTIRKDVFTGSTQSAFDNYVTANDIDVAYIPESYQLKFINGASFDLIPFIRKSNLEVKQIEWEVKEITGKRQLDEIFF